MRDLLRRLGGWSVSLALCIACTGRAQTAPAVKAFHPEGPLASYEVATIKPADPAKGFSGMTLRRYIGMAYGVPFPWGLPGVTFEGSQVIGGPEWIDKDKYDITGKPAEEMREAMKTMSSQDRTAQQEMMEQSLLAERFHLKVHFEAREMAGFELVPAKGGLKITPLEPVQTEDQGLPRKNGELSPGNMQLSVGRSGLNILNARAMTMEMLANAIRGEAPEIGGRPVINQTGFTGKFDLKDFRFLGFAYTQGPPASAANPDEPDAPSLQQALEQQLGLKLVPTKAKVEVVVVDSIDRPTDN